MAGSPQVPTADKTSHFVLNHNIIDSDLNSVPEDLVLLFEGSEGWNHIGGLNYSD